MTVAFADFHRLPGIYLDSAESVLNGVIRDVSPGLPPGIFVALIGIVIGGICLAFVRLPRPAVMLGVTVLVFAFCASTTGYAFERLLSSDAASGFPVTGQDRVRNWVDGAAEGRTVALLPYPVSRDWGQSAVAWWDAEFWNNTIQPDVRRPERSLHVRAVPLRCAAYRPGRRRRRDRARSEVRPGGARRTRGSGSPGSRSPPTSG